MLSLLASLASLASNPNTISIDNGLYNRTGACVRTLVSRRPVPETTSGRQLHLSLLLFLPSRER